VSDGDEHLPSAIDGINLVMNRTRLAAFLTQFAEDRDVRDLLALDVLGVTAGLPLSSTGAAEAIPTLAFRPFRIWEYTWLYKTLGLSKGGAGILDLGGPASHLTILAALAGSSVTSIDVNPTFVDAAQECARVLKLDRLKAREGDMRDLSGFPDESFDVVLSCSVLEHLSAEDQEAALGEMARVLKPRGVAALTFDYGPAAPGANENLPPPHAPPPDAAEALRRYLRGGLVVAGNAFTEDPTPGVLFRDERASYTLASLFLAKPPAPDMPVPRCECAGSALTGLVIPELPLRVYRTMAFVRDAIDERAIFKAMAAERLAGMLEKDEALARLRSELEARDAVIREKDEALREPMRCLRAALQAGLGRIQRFFSRDARSSR